MNSILYSGIMSARRTTGIAAQALIVQWPIRLGARRASATGRCSSCSDTLSKMGPESRYGTLGETRSFPPAALGATSRSLVCIQVGEQRLSPSALPSCEGLHSVSYVRRLTVFAGGLLEFPHHLKEKTRGTMPMISRRIPWCLRAEGGPGQFLSASRPRAVPAQNRRTCAEIHKQNPEALASKSAAAVRRKHT